MLRFQVTDRGRGFREERLQYGVEFTKRVPRTGQDGSEVYR